MSKSLTNKVVKFLALFSGSGLLLLSLTFPLASIGAFTEQINYQGKLTNTAGSAVADGNYSIVFTLYNASSGGSSVWTETQTVAVANGLFSVMLGSVASLSSVDFNQSLYLTINVNGDGEMSPRKLISAVPNAFNTSKFDGLATTSFLRADITNATATITNLNSQYLDVSGNATTTNLAVTSSASLPYGTWIGSELGAASIEFLNYNIPSGFGTGSNINLIRASNEAPFTGTLGVANVLAVYGLDGGDGSIILGNDSYAYNTLISQNSADNELTIAQVDSTLSAHSFDRIKITANELFLEGDSDNSDIVFNFDDRGAITIATTTSQMNFTGTTGYNFTGVMGTTTARVTLPISIRSLGVSGDYLYASLYGSGVDSFRIINISDPNHPFVANNDLVTLPDAPAKKIQVSGDYVYVSFHTATGTDAFRIIDVSDKSNPVVIGGQGLDIRQSISVGEPLYISGNYLYFLVNNKDDTSSSDLVIIDVSDPHNPTIVSRLENLPATAWDMKVNGNYAYGCFHDTATPLAIINVKDKKSPFIIATSSLGNINEYCWSIESSGSHLYLGLGQFGNDSNTDTFRIVNIDDPYNPVILGGSEMDFGIFQGGVGALNYMKFFGQYLYATTWGGYFYKINVSSSTNPVIEDSYELNEGSGDNDAVAPISFDFKGNNLFVGFAPVLATEESTRYLRVYSLPGINSEGGLFSSLFAGLLRVGNDAIFDRRVSIADSLLVGSGGIMSEGALSITGTTTSSYFAGSLGIGTTSPMSKFSVVGESSFNNTINYSGDIFETEVKMGSTNNVNFMGVTAPFASGLYVNASGTSGSVPPIGVVSIGLLSYLGIGTAETGSTGMGLYGGIESTGVGIFADSYGLDMTVGLSSTYGSDARTNPIMMNTYLYPNQGGYGWKLTIEDDYASTTNPNSYNTYGAYLEGNGYGTGLFMSDFSTGINLDLADGAYGLRVDNGSSTGYAIYSDTGLNYFGGSVGIGTTTLERELTVEGDLLVQSSTSSANYQYDLSFGTNKGIPISYLYDILGLKGVASSYSISESNFDILDWYINASTTYNPMDVGFYSEGSIGLVGHGYMAGGVFTASSTGLSVDVGYGYSGGDFSAQGIDVVVHGNSNNHSTGLNIDMDMTSADPDDTSYGIRIEGSNVGSSTAIYIDSDYEWGVYSNGNNYFNGIDSQNIEALNLNVTSVLSALSIYIPSFVDNGAVYVNGGFLTNVNPSSRDYKSNITETELNIDALLNLQVKAFTWNTNNQNDFGLIAEEIQEALPELYVDNGQVKGYRADHLPFYLLQIAQRQALQITELDNRIASGTINFASTTEVLNLPAIQSLTGTWSISADGTIIAKTIKVDQLCLGTTCVNEEDLKSLLDKANISITTPVIIETPIENSGTTTDPAPLPPETSSSTEPIVENPPAQEPEPTETNSPPTTPDPSSSDVPVPAETLVL